MPAAEWRQSETHSAIAPHSLATAPPAKGPPGMAWIPGGQFMMGTNSQLGWPDEKPRHPVRVSGFWMDIAEVTNAEFRAFHRRDRLPNHCRAVRRRPKKSWLNCLPMCPPR